MNLLAQARRTKSFIGLAKAIDGSVQESISGYEPVRFRSRKILRDSVFEFNSYQQHEVNLIDSPVIQRLRNIYQTSLAALTYPCSNHSRFEHSLSCVGLVQKVASAIGRRQPGAIPQKRLLELRLAALMHDCGHGPFSHASETVYERLPIFKKLREENPELFLNPKNGAGEILSFLIVTSAAFGSLWKKVLKLYKKDTAYHNRLKSIDLDDVGLLILGKLHLSAGGNVRFMDQIINGPFDVDKIDYINRDGYFTGLSTSLDFARLLETIHVFKDRSSKSWLLAVDTSGATCIEQMLYSKMLLFAVVYHHQKVRASYLMVKSIFERIEKSKWKVNGLNFTSPEHFLQVDDTDLLNYSNKKGGLKDAIYRVRNRVLPKVALVLSYYTLEHSDSFENLMSMASDDQKLNDLRKEIADSCTIDELDIHIDVPTPPTFRKITEAGCVRISDQITVPFEDIFPTAGWVQAYAQNRYRAYIFCPSSSTKKVATQSAKILRRHGIRVTRDAFALAKLDVSCAGTKKIGDLIAGR